MGSLESPSPAPAENNEQEQVMTDVRNQLDQLRAMFEQGQDTPDTPEAQQQKIKDAMDAMAASIHAATEAGISEQQLDDAIAERVDLANDDLEARLESDLQKLVDFRGNLTKLRAEVDATTTTETADTQAPKEDESMVTMMASGIQTGLDFAKKYVDTMDDGRVKTLLYKVLEGLSGAIVGAIEGLAKTPIASFLIGDADIVDIGNMRLTLQEKTLEAFPELQATYQANQAKFKEEWLAAYMTWFKGDRKNAMPTLLDTVRGAPATASAEDSAEVAPGAAAVFSAESPTERTIGSNESVELPASASESILLNNGKLKIQINGQVTEVQLQSGNNNVQIDRITRTGADVVDVGAFVLHGRANSGDFAVAKLLDAFKKLNDSIAESTIENTQITVKKIA